MRFALSPSRTERRRAPAGPSPRRSRGAGFTLVEVLAALLMMAIVVPVTMEGMSIASRAGILGQRKAAAMRVAERVLTELIVEGDTTQTSTSGVATDGDISYPWTMRSENWPEDPMLELTVVVTFTLQGNDYTVSASTLMPSTAPAEETPLPAP